MTALVSGARKVLGRGGSLDNRIAALEQAAEAARGRLDPELVERASETVQRARVRLRLSADHTVVALAGATGSGKSSTFNALAGLDLAAVGVRRPTTSTPTACVWGTSPADDLLEWLGIPPRHRVVRDSMLDAGRADRSLDGLVLLDLPDHDSTEVSHLLEVERLVPRADLLVWVVDPQKYADAALHERFLRPLATHAGVMLVVLNRVDEVAPDDRQRMVGDVRRLLEADGLSDVPVLATSARTGEGIVELRRLIAKRVSDKAAARTRLAADVQGAVAVLAEACGDAAPRALREKDKTDVLDALADAAGVPVVVDAVHRATTARARRATGFPLTSWLSRLRPDPLRRLHLDLGRSGKDLVATARSSVPRANQVQQARVESAVRGLAERVSDGLARPWARAVRHASTSRFGDLTDALDRAVGTTDLGVSGTPVWWRLVRVLQWLLLLTALAGGVWLLVLAGLSYLQVPAPQTPRSSGLPLPTLMLVGAVVLGLLLALVSRGFIALGARSRASRADRRLRGAVTEVAESLVFAPVEAELAAHRRTCEGLRSAGG